MGGVGAGMTLRACVCVKHVCACSLPIGSYAGVLGQVYAVTELLNETWCAWGERWIKELTAALVPSPKSTLHCVHHFLPLMSLFSLFFLIFSICCSALMFSSDIFWFVFSCAAICFPTYVSPSICFCHFYTNSNWPVILSLVKTPVHVPYTKAHAALW